MDSERVSSESSARGSGGVPHLRKNMVLVPLGNSSCQVSASEGDRQDREGRSGLQTGIPDRADLLLFSDPSCPLPSYGDGKNSNTRKRMSTMVERPGLPQELSSFGDDRRLHLPHYRHILGPLLPSFPKLCKTNEEIGVEVLKAEKDWVVGTSSEPPKDEGYLCTTLCDCLLDFPRTRDEKRTTKILAGLYNCYPCDQPIKGDTYWIDIRGRHMFEVESIIGRFPQMMLRNYKRVNVRVGCNKHGVGEGKLKNLVIQILKRDSMDFTSEGSIVSIRRPGLEELFGVPPAGVSGTMGENEVVKAKGNNEVVHNVDELCTITCDMLLGMSRSWEQWDEGKDKEFIQKVLIALEKCNKSDDRDQDMKDNAIDLRGMYISDVTQVLVDCFSRATGSGFQKFIVGCKKHGIGNGNLKKTVIDMLIMEKSIQVKDQGYFVSGKIEGPKDLSLIRKVILSKFDEEQFRITSELFNEVMKDDEGMVDSMPNVNFDFMSQYYKGFVADCSLKSKMDTIIAQMKNDAITSAQIEKKTRLEFVVDDGVRTRGEAIKNEQINRRSI